MPNWIDSGSPVHLRRSEITIATLLRDAGYDTCHVGKWHLNGRFNRPDQPQPRDHGFEHWFSTQNNAAPTHKNPRNFVRNGTPLGVQEGYSSHIVAKEAIRWLKEDHERDKPFFMYVCFHEPHEVIASAPEYMSRYADLPLERREHHANITQMDAAVGKILAALDEGGYRDNTLVVFTSDNGPARTPRHPFGSAGPLRGMKGDMYEGGIRVPGIIRWPGHADAGSESDEPVSPSTGCRRSASSPEARSPRIGSWTGRPCCPCSMAADPSQATALLAVQLRGDSAEGRTASGRLETARGSHADAPSDGRQHPARSDEGDEGGGVG